MMDFDYVVAPSLIVLAGIIVAWLSIRRVFSLRAKRTPGSSHLMQGVIFVAVAAVALCVAAISGFNAVILYKNKLELPGKTYLVSGHRMRIDCSGSGSPALVLEAGAGNDGLNWGGVQPALSKTTRVCSYDRAGFGGSDPMPPPRDADHVAAELHGLLQAADVRSPVVLMGHSMGGLFIRDYASHYPGDVAGLIFVDSSTPLQNRNPVFMAHDKRGLASTLNILMNRATLISGVPRLFGLCSSGKPPGFDATAAKFWAEDKCHQPYPTLANESRSFDRSGEETLHSGPYGALPILIFSQDPAEDPNHAMTDLEETWNQMQEDLKKLSTHSRRIIAKGSGHFVHFNRPDLIDREVPLFIEQIRGIAPGPASGSTVTE